MPTKKLSAATDVLSTDEIWFPVQKDGEWVWKKISKSVLLAGVTVDESANYTWAGEHTWDISGDKSFYVVDDATTPTKYFGIFDGVDLPETSDHDVFGYNLYISGYNAFGNSWYYDKTDFSGGYSSAAQNTNGGVIETAFVLADGTSQKTISANEIYLNCPYGGFTVGTMGGGNITFTAPELDNDKFIVEMAQVHSGYKSGTLASPPAGMVIGEVWADTTDSATHPIYRISTVAT